MVDIIYARINEIYENGVTLILPGDSTPTTKRYNYLTGYEPKVNDRVAVIKHSGTMFVLGAFAIK